MLWLNGQPVDAAVWNRGLAFGDGVFETLTFRDQHAPLWSLHMQRLQRACEVLALQMPDTDQLHQQCLTLLSKTDAVIRITLVRKQLTSSELPSSLAAYGSASGINDVDILMRSRALPQRSNDKLHTDWAQLRLARQPLLAGIKHLNRLEQVLAAREALQQGVDELLLQDTEGQVIEAISSNLLVHDGQRWLTPALHDSGVAGVMRQWLLKQQLINEQPMLPADITQAHALALCNSVRGVQAIDRHVGKDYPLEPIVALQQAVRPLGL